MILTTNNNKIVYHKKFREITGRMIVFCKTDRFILSQKLNLFYMQQQQHLQFI